MKTTIINGKIYSVRKSTWHSDYSSLFIKYENGTEDEFCVAREWNSIKDNNDAKHALSVLWPSQYAKIN